MGNSSSNPPPEGEVRTTIHKTLFFQEILVHSFLLDADFDTCQIPRLCPRKNVSTLFCSNFTFPLLQAMFHPPTALNENVLQFLSLGEAKKILTDLNMILHRTAFSPRASNPCFILAILISLAFCGFSISFFLPSQFDTAKPGKGDSGSSIGFGICFLLLGLFLPYLCFFFLVAITKSARKRQLVNYVGEWNR